jgi:hypothetical protein
VHEFLQRHPIAAFARLGRELKGAKTHRAYAEHLRILAEGAEPL